MATIPPQPSRRSSSREEQTPSEQDVVEASTQSMSEWESMSTPLSAPEAADIPHVSTAEPTSEKKEPRRCWICQLDDTEDTPESTAWRKPCPCSLEAHDECLLEWISAEEAPKKGELAHSKRIKCPQCSHEIMLERPRNYVVDLIAGIQQAGRLMIIPTAASAVFVSTYTGLLVYGVASMNLVFGADETLSILFPSAPTFIDRIVGGYVRQDLNVRLFFSLPLVGPALILLRTRLFEQTSALTLPLYFLYPENRDILWPPTPGLTFALLPYIKTAYNGLYYHFFGKLEKKWELAVQRKPRDGETAEEIHDAEEEGDDEDAVFQLQIDIVEEEIEPHLAQVDPPAPGQDVAIERPPLNNRNRRNRGRNEHGEFWRGDVSLDRVASTVVGALAFPTISHIMGTILKHSLPSSWVTPPFSYGRTMLNRGLLKEQWGRSLVGGCLFVVLKDMFTLYCKYKKARDFGKLKILDYVERKDKRRSNGPRENVQRFRVEHPRPPPGRPLP